MALLKVLSAKKGQIGMNPAALVSFLIGIFLVFLLGATFIPLAQTQGDNLQAATNESQPTVSGFFGSGGVLFTLLLIGIFISIIAGLGFMKFGSGGRGRR